MRAIAGLALVALLFGSCAARAQPPEPPGYRMDEYRAPTPATVAGGIALDTEGAHKLWASGGAVWIDVLPAPHRPASLPASTLWVPLPHRNIPGSIWLPDVGRGALSSELQTYFRNHLAAATKGRRDAPVALYCQSNCWMSWNAAKRVASWGYKAVYWYPDGIDGWEAAKLPMENASPAPGF